MEWIKSLLLDQTTLQALVAIFLTMAVGIPLGRIRIKGVSLGATFVFFTGILMGHLGLKVEPHMLEFARDFGIVIYIYALGLQVGPGFFNSFRKGGFTYNGLSLLLILLGAFAAVGFGLLSGINVPNATGIFAGATTTTAALVAEQQFLDQVGMDSVTPSLGCAVAYPMGVIGMLFTMLVMKAFAGTPRKKEASDDQDSTFVATFQITNPALDSLNIEEIRDLVKESFVVSRLWRGDQAMVPSSDTKVQLGDRIMVVTQKKANKHLRVLFGKIEDKNWNTDKVDWDSIDNTLVSRDILITKGDINGKTIASLKPRRKYGVTISRVKRSGMLLLATPGLELRSGDLITVVGLKDAIDKMTDDYGNSPKDLDKPRILSICIGIVLGLCIGAIPLSVPGISAPIKMGLAGGPIIAGILVGAFGPKIHMNTYTTESASMMIRELGLDIFLACLGLAAGPKFVSTVMNADGLIWLAAGLFVSIVPALIVGFLAMKVFHLEWGPVCGMLCGSCGSSMVVSYPSSNWHNNEVDLIYAQTYPLGAFLRVVAAQIMVMLAV